MKTYNITSILASVILQINIVNANPNEENESNSKYWILQYEKGLTALKRGDCSSVVYYLGSVGHMLHSTGRSGTLLTKIDNLVEGCLHELNNYQNNQSSGLGVN